MAVKPKIIAGAWTAVGCAAGAFAYRHIREFEDKTPGVREAVRMLAGSGDARAALGKGQLFMARWPRAGAVDLKSGLARASFEVRGEAGSVHVVMGAHRRPKAQAAWEQAVDEEEDDEEEGLSGWRRYWARPWELKLLMLGRLRGGDAAQDESKDEELAWDVDSLFFLPGGDVSKPIVLVGDPAGLPEYEAMCIRRDAEAKGESSQRRLRTVIWLATSAAVLAGGLRLAKSMRVSQSYGYVRRVLLQHKEVAAALGPRASVQTSSGTFGSTYINARFRLVGDRGALADVDVAATRDGSTRNPWRIALARMNVGGLTYNLDTSQF